MSAAGPVISTNGLTKHFGRLTVVDGVSLDVREGDIFGFLGPNGSGKTTTIRMLLGLVNASAGDVELFGRPMPRYGRDVLPHVGVLVENPGFYASMSGRRNLTLFDAAGPGSDRADRADRVDAALERVGLAGIDRRPVRAYSTGMCQRLGLAAVLMRQPRLLVLDEPTNGLDPQGIRDVRSLLVDIAATGTTIFLSSHLLAEVEQICTRAAMMSQGRLVAQDRIDRLLAPTGRLIVVTPDADSAVTVLSRFSPVERTGDRLRVQLNGVPPERLNQTLVEAGVRVRELVVERRTLEDAYVGLTGRSGDVRS
jgi:ABC-2 type transport system ATP-binding protein